MADLDRVAIFPTSTVGIAGYPALRQAANPDALAYYHELFTAMRERGITPMVTLNHYTLPTWIHDALGCHKDITTCTARGWGLFLAIPEFKVSFKHLVEAHARMYDAVKAGDTGDADGDGQPSRVGVVSAVSAAAPKDPANPLDVTGTKNLKYLLNQVFLAGAVKGDLDDEFDGTPTHRTDLANRCDFVGLNYYVHLTVTGTPSSLLPTLSPLLTFDFRALGQDFDTASHLRETLDEVAQRDRPHRHERRRLGRELARRHPAYHREGAQRRPTHRGLLLLDPV